MTVVISPFMQCTCVKVAIVPLANKEQCFQSSRHKAKASFLLHILYACSTLPHVELWNLAWWPLMGIF